LSVLRVNKMEQFGDDDLGTVPPPRSCHRLINVHNCKYKRVISNKSIIHTVTHADIKTEHIINT
jgi:hypothetical protein